MATVKIQIEAKANTAAIDEVAAKLRALRDKTVKIKLDVDNASLRRIDNIRDKRIKVDLDVNDSRIRQIANRRVKVNVDVDDSSLTRLQTRLASLRNQTVNVRVRATEDRINERARNLIRNRTANINVAVSGLAAAEAAIAAVARNRTARIRLDVDAGAAAALTQILNALSGAGNAGNNAGRVAGGLSSMASSSSGLARMAPALAVIVPAVSVLASGAIGAGVYGTAAALGAVTGAAGLVGAGFAAGIAALPIAAAATSQKVKDHFTFMKNDVVDTMKQIAQPVQEPLVNLATSLGAAFHQMRPSLEAITNGTADLVNYLSGKLPDIAAQAGPALEKMFAGGVPHLKNLIDTMPDLLKSMGEFGDSLGSPEVVEGAKRVFGMIPEIISGAGKGIETAAKGFESVMGFLDSGKMDGFASGIGDFFTDLSNTDWSGVTSGLADAGNAFGDFMANIDTESLATNLEGGLQFITDMTTAVDKLTSKFTEYDNKFREGNKEMGGGPVEWGAKAAEWMKKATLESIGDFGGSGLADKLFGGAPPNIPVELTPEGGGSGLTEALPPFLEVPLQLTPPATSSLPPIPIVGEVQPVAPPSGLVLPLIGEFQAPPEVPAPAPIPLLGVMPDIVAPSVPPVELTAAPLPAPAPPAPVPVDIVVADGQVTVPPPAPVPVTFDVTQPTLNLSVPPVPITFDVSLPQITIPAVEASAFVTVTSNASSVAAEISALSAGTSSLHTVSTNAGAVVGEIMSLNGMNTSSTHTINVVKTGDTGEGAPR